MESPSEFDQSKIRVEIHKRMWKATNVLFWGTFSLLPLIAILDYFLIPDQWLQLLFFKVLLLPILFGVYKIVQNLELKPTVLLHVTLILLNIHFMSIVFQPIEPYRFVYFILLITIFISFNSIAIWSMVDALFQFVVLLAGLAAAFYFRLIDNIDQFMVEGGYLYIGASLVSTVYPQIRFLTLKDSVKLQLMLENSFENYKVRSSELEARFKQLGEMTDQKNEKLRIARHDIRNKISNIHSLVTLIQTPGDAVSAKDKDNYLHIINEVCEELLYLIEQLLQPFNMESDSVELEMHPEPVDFNKEIQDVLLSLNDLIFSKNIQVDNFLSQASYVI